MDFQSLTSSPADCTPARPATQAQRSRNDSATMIVRIAALLALLLVAEALPAPPGRRDDRRVTVSKYNNLPNTGDGAYRYEFELSDGSRRYEEGELQNAGVPGKEFLVVRGSFSRPSFDGTSMEQVMYFADEEGFHLARMVPQLGGAPSAGLIASLVG